MLFNPSWEVHSLEGHIAWLETKPADGTYNWKDIRGNCLYGQYMAARGIPWKIAISPQCKLVRDAIYQLAFPFPWTFGAALERARKAIA